jgi:hypothetical protein
VWSGGLGDGMRDLYAIGNTTRIRALGRGLFGLREGERRRLRCRIPGLELGGWVGSLCWVLGRRLRESRRL